MQRGSAKFEPDIVHFVCSCSPVFSFPAPRTGISCTCLFLPFLYPIPPASSVLFSFSVLSFSLSQCLDSVSQLQPSCDETLFLFKSAHFQSWSRFTSLDRRRRSSSTKQQIPPLPHINLCSDSHNSSAPAQHIAAQRLSASPSPHVAPGVSSRRQLS